MNKKIVIAVVILVTIFGISHINLIQKTNHLEEEKSQLQLELKEVKEINNQMHDDLVMTQKQVNTLEEKLDTIATYNENHEDLEDINPIDTFEMCSNLIVDEISLNLTLSEKELYHLFGTPDEENIEVIGTDDVWYLEGKHKKVSYYESFNLYFHGDKEGNNYELIAFSTESDQLQLENGLQVGDTRDDLIDLYPDLIELTWGDAEVRYLYPDDFGMRGVFFDIENDKISKITVTRLFD